MVTLDFEGCPRPIAWNNGNYAWVCNALGRTPDWGGEEDIDPQEILEAIDRFYSYIRGDSPKIDYHDRGVKSRIQEFIPPVRSLTDEAIAFLVEEGDMKGCDQPPPVYEGELWEHGSPIDLRWSDLQDRLWLLSCFTKAAKRKGKKIRTY